MAHTMFSSLNFNETEYCYIPLKGCVREDAVPKYKQVPAFGMEDCGGVDSICPDYGIHDPENMSDKTVPMFEDQQQTVLDYWMQNDLHHSNMPLSVQSIYEAPKHGEIQIPFSELNEPIQENAYPFSLPSLELPSNYGSGLEKSRDENLSNPTNGSGRKLSTEQIMRVAGERYIQFSTQKVNGFAMFIHPYGSSLSSLSIEEVKNVELAHLLLAAAEKVGYRQFDIASRLLSHCEQMASDSGNPVQRVVFYFAEALRERIDRETGSIDITKRVNQQVRQEECLALGTNLSFLAGHQELPFNQVIQFTGVQAIIDNVAMATKVHLIDLEIRSGIQWTSLMQGLAERDERPIELLKVTALGTTNKQDTEETGKRLTSFAESLNLPFSFNIVFLSDMKDIKEELFHIEADEAVAVYSQMLLRTMISRPDRLEALMRVIRKLKPLVMVLAEVEANHNSPSFVTRFTEALFFYSAFFDCLEDSVDRFNQFRMTLEGNYFRSGIRNMISTEGEKRVCRSVKINMWRAFFARFRMVEIGLSESSLYQARLVLEQFPCGSSCTLENNGKCLIIGWKGTPIHSLSIWKFK